MSKRSVARISKGSPQNLARLARRLQTGEIVAVPTETVYGLAANAFDPKACVSVFRAKGRPRNDPLIVHLYSRDQLSLVCRPNLAAIKLARRFWPGPLTLVLPKHAGVPSIVTAGRDSVAVRVPRHPLFRRLLKLTGLPLAAPSANPFGYVSPTTAGHVRDGLGHRIADILDGGPSPIGLESTIVDLRRPNHPRVLRPGAVTRAALEKVLGRKVVMQRSKGAHRAQLAPGMLARHYSPRTPVVLHEKITRDAPATEAFVLIRKPAGPRPPNVFWLTSRGNLREAARRLFGLLRDLDHSGFARIHVELARGEGLALAINDRLRRAAAR